MFADLPPCAALDEELILYLAIGDSFFDARLDIVVDKMEPSV